MTAATTNETTAPEQLLTVEQVALRLQVNQITVLRLIWQKKLEACKVGSLWRIRPAAVQEYLDGETNDGSPPRWPYCSV
jgi:excisionase family DNA binding protein